MLQNDNLSVHSEIQKEIIMNRKETDWIERGEMDRDSDIESMRGLAGNIGYRNRKKRSNTPLSPLVVGSIVMILLIAFFILFSRSCGKERIEEINSILGRLDQLEEKLPQYAEIGSKIDRLESQVKEFQKSMSKLDRDGTSLRSELGTINKQVSLLKEEFSSVSRKMSNIGTVQKQIPPQVQGGYHEVQKGESLYGIANKYGLSVEELRSMNNISKGQDTIYPGQKILVK